MTDAAPATLANVCELLAGIRDLLHAHDRPPAEVFTRDDMAAVLGMGVSTFDKLKAAGRIGPQPFHCSGVKWHRGEVLAWLLARDHRGQLHDTDTWPPVWASLQPRPGIKNR